MGMRGSLSRGSRTCHIRTWGIVGCGTGISSAVDGLLGAVAFRVGRVPWRPLVDRVVLVARLAARLVAVPVFRLPVPVRFRAACPVAFRAVVRAAVPPAVRPRAVPVAFLAGPVARLRAGAAFLRVRTAGLFAVPVRLERPLDRPVDRPEDRPVERPVERVVVPAILAPPF